MTKMYKKIFILIILLSAIAFAAEEDYNNYGNLKISLEISTGVSMIKTSQDYKIEFISANVSLFPKSSISQNILDLKTSSTPKADEIKGETILFTWTNPMDYNKLKISSLISSKNTIIPVKSKVSFPLNNLNSALKEYTKETKFIDITPAIVSKANEIVSGETDLYEVVYKLADWTRNNIQYNLSTLTAEVTQKSSWVLENKQGVCKEMSSLFVSFLRSIGVPARFVSGVAYTNIGYEFGGHAWTEVYFPGYGWIPFDPTYGQYGWVDPTHIKLSDSYDSTDPSIRYAWKAIDVDLKSDKIDVNANIIDSSGLIDPLIRLKVIPLKNEVSPGSYIPLKIIAENLQDFYIPITIQITKAPKLTEKNTKSILLKPMQQKNIFWIIEIPDDAEKNYLYTTTIEATDFFGSLDSAKISYAYNYPKYSLEEAREEIKKYEEKEEKSYSTELAMDCNAEKNYFLAYETPKINCNIKNTGNTIISQLDVCMDSNCTRLNLNIAEEKTMDYETNNSGEIKITAKNEKIDLARYLNINILKDPGLRISNIKTPEAIDYYSFVNITFSLNTDALVKDIEASLNGKDIFKINQLSNTKKINLYLDSSQLSEINNIKIRYKDENSKEYIASEEFNIVITNLPWYLKIADFFKSLF